jgi:hypothetical protein
MNADAKLVINAMPTPIENKLIIESEQEYHEQAGRPYVSSHLLSTFRWCPLIYNLTVNKVFMRPDSAAFTLGRAVHALVLEGEDAYRVRYTANSPVNPSTGKSYGKETKKFTAWADEVKAQGKEAITNSDEELAFHMAGSLAKHKEAVRLFNLANYRERVLREVCVGLNCQSRLDAYGEQIGICDLKTCESLDKLPYQAKSFRYIEQLAFYRMVVRAANLPCPSVHIIGVEKQFPYRCGVWKVEESSLDVAEQSNQSCMAELGKCQRANNWPTGYEKIRLMSV